MTATGGNATTGGEQPKVSNWWALGCLVPIALVAAIIFAVVSGGDDDEADRPFVWSSTAPVPATTSTTSLSEDEIGEQAFLTMMRLKYTQYAAASDESVIAVGNSICTDMAAGMTFIQVGLSIAAAGSLAATDGAYIAGAAIGSICPQYKSEITR